MTRYNTLLEEESWIHNVYPLYRINCVFLTKFGGSFPRQHATGTLPRCSPNPPTSRFRSKGLFRTSQLIVASEVIGDFRSTVYSAILCCVLRKLTVQTS